MSVTLTPNTIPIVMTTTGPTPTPPATLLANLIAYVAAGDPGYTANLPGLLIEDISSTDVGALVICDNALTDLINSCTPYGVNEFLLTQLGNVLGTPIQSASNTSVNVVFTGTPGFVIPIGFLVGDGTYQYSVQDGGIVGSAGENGLGVSASLYCLATTTGSWAVPTGTVTQLVTSLPAGVAVTVTNPSTGTPGVATGETPVDYRVRVLQGGLASAQGMARFLRTLLGNVSGVQPRLIGIRQQSQPNPGWEIIVGGGDPYQVADAIFDALFDVSSIVGSTLVVTAVTRANPAVVKVDLNHGYTSGQRVTFANVGGMVELNGNTYTATVINQTQFSINVDSSTFFAFTSGGVVTPNFRNEVVNINDYPDNYAIPIVRPPQQTVAVTLTWNTIANENQPQNFVNPVAVAQLANPVIVNYINGIFVGQPINVFVMNSLFQEAIESLIDISLLGVIDFAVSINSIGVSPTSGTGLIYGDPESYFFTTTGDVVVEQAT